MKFISYEKINYTLIDRYKICFRFKNYENRYLGE